MVSIAQTLPDGIDLRVGPDPVVYSVEYLANSDGETVGLDTFEETIFSYTTPAAAWSDVKIRPTLAGRPLVLESLSPSIAEIINGDTVTKVDAGGLYRILIKDGLVGAVFVGSNQTGVTTSGVFNSFEPGSISDVLASGILDRITPGKSNTLYSDYNRVATFVPTYDPNCWAAGLTNASGLTLATTLFGGWDNANRGAAVTAQHVVCCTHFGNMVGKKVRFRATDNTLVDRTVIGRKVFADLQVVTLDSPLPPTVVPVKVVGTWFCRNYKTVGANAADFYCGGAVCWLDQFGKFRYQLAGVNAWRLARSSSTAQDVTFNGTPYTQVQYSATTYGSAITPTPDIMVGKTDFYGIAVSGDSGSPVGVIIGNEFALAGVWTTPTSFAAAFPQNILPDMIADADADAGIPATGLTVTVAPDPTA